MNKDSAEHFMFIANPSELPRGVIVHSRQAAVKLLTDRHKVFSETTRQCIRQFLEGSADFLHIYACGNVFSVRSADGPSSRSNLLGEVIYNFWISKVDIL